MKVRRELPRILLISNCDSLSRLVFSNINSKEVRIVGVVQTGLNLQTKANLLLKVIKKRALVYAIYQQLEILFARMVEVFFKKLFFQKSSFQPDIIINDRKTFYSKDFLGYVKSLKASYILSVRPELIFPAYAIENLPPIINLHCSLLPSHGGIGGVLQALASEDIKLGVSFHLIENEKIDDGRIVLQDLIATQREKSVFFHTFKLYQKAGLMLRYDIGKLVRNINSSCDQRLFKDQKKSYNSWPTKSDYENLKLNGFQLLGFEDLIQIIKRNSSWMN
jgi:methionyl-tRNA formyltransferase